MKYDFKVLSGIHEKVNRFWIVLLIGVVIGVFFLLHNSFMKTKETVAEQGLFQSKVVKVEYVSASFNDDKLSYPGVVKAWRESVLAFRVGGPLIGVRVKVGDVVKKGDLLMQLDSRDFNDKIMSLKAQILGAKANVKNEKANYSRALKLYEQNVMPQSDYDHALNAYDVANAELNVLEVSLEIAEHAFEDTSLLAPFDGIITMQYVENYEIVQRGQMVLSLHDISMLEVDVDIPENEMIKKPIVGKEKAFVYFPAIPNRSFEAELKEWHTVADSVTRTYKLTFSFIPPDDLQVLPGMTAEVFRFTGVDRKNVPVVPVKSVVSDVNGKSFVWVCDTHKKVRQKYIILGKLIGHKNIEVLDGLVLGDLIVIEGVDYLIEGMCVEPKLEL